MTPTPEDLKAQIAQDEAALAAKKAQLAAMEQPFRSMIEAGARAVSESGTAADWTHALSISETVLKAALPLAPKQPVAVEQRCPACHVKFREITDVDNHLATLARVGGASWPSEAELQEMVLNSVGSVAVYKTERMIAVAEQSALEMACRLRERILGTRP